MLCRGQQCYTCQSYTAVQFLLHVNHEAKGGCSGLSASSGQLKFIWLVSEESVHMMQLLWSPEQMYISHNTDLENGGKVSGTLAVGYTESHTERLAQRFHLSSFN